MINSKTEEMIQAQKRKDKKSDKCKYNYFRINLNQFFISLVIG